MRVLYEADMERLAQMNDKNIRSVYVLLKYWQNKPKKWDELWKKLLNVYRDDTEWEYLITYSLEGKGLKWIGGDYLQNPENGEEYLVDPNLTWQTSELGKSHITNNFYELDYMLSKKEKGQVIAYTITTTIAFAALIFSVFSYYYPRNTSDNNNLLLQRMDSLQLRLLKLEQNILMQERVTPIDHHTDKSNNNTDLSGSDLETMYQ